jgi:hypothetical protein
MSGEREEERLFPSSPNWYCTKVSDVSIGTPSLLGFGSRNVVRLLQVSDDAKMENKKILPFFVGSPIGHKRTCRITAFSFSRLEGVAHLCVTGATDRSVRVW